MTDAYQALASLRKMLTVEREKHKDALAEGRGADETQQLVGRCKALKWVTEKVSEQIKQVNGGDENGNAANG